MFGYNYNSSTRRYVALMGALFSHIEVARNDRFIKVPITFANKENFVRKLETINNSSDGDDSVAKIETILPRMCLSIIDVNMNPLFKTNITNREMMTREGIRPVTTSQFNPVPYKYMFELSIYTRHEDDVFQIIEQILPYFQPNYTCKTTELHTNEIKIDRDIVITLQSLSIDENPDTDRFSRRRIEWSIIFELDGWIYPPIKDVKGEIKTVYVDFFANVHHLNPEGNFESVDVTTCPDPSVTLDEWNGKPKYGYSDNTPIPSGGDPTGPRGIVSGCGEDN